MLVLHAACSASHRQGRGIGAPLPQMEMPAVAVLPPDALYMRDNGSQKWENRAMLEDVTEPRRLAMVPLRYRDRLRKPSAV